MSDWLSYALLALFVLQVTGLVVNWLLFDLDDAFGSWLVVTFWPVVVMVGVSGGIMRMLGLFAETGGIGYEDSGRVVRRICLGIWFGTYTPTVGYFVSRFIHVGTREHGFTIGKKRRVAPPQPVRLDDLISKDSK